MTTKRITTWPLFALCCAAALMLAGCEILVKESADDGWVGILPASTLTINRPVLVPPERSRIFFRGGQLARTSGGYRTSCWLEVQTLSKTSPRRIAPATFKIVRVQPYRAEVAALDTQPRLRMANHGQGGYSMIQNGFHFWLENADYPAVRRLTCLGELAEPPKAFPPTLAGIRTALGDWITLDLNTEPRL